MKKIAVYLLLTSIFSFNGCQVVAILGSPTLAETPVPAEYSIAERTDGKVLVFVEQPAWVNLHTDLRPVLSDAINLLLRKKAGIRKKAIIAYEQLAKSRRARSDFSSLQPEQIGAALGAETVLVVAIDDYQLYELSASGYYKSLLSVRGYLLDAPSGELLWPQSKEAKIIKVGFDAEAGGRETSVAKLAKALAHCLVRYFYDCSKEKFRTWGEKTDYSGEKW